VKGGGESAKINSTYEKKEMVEGITFRTGRGAGLMTNSGESCGGGIRTDWGGKVLEGGEERGNSKKSELKKRNGRAVGKGSTTSRSTSKVKGGQATGGGKIKKEKNMNSQDRK